tara:strand:+ start:72 stop:242 length:171 start_codon:yes stop_codon:yes gene_type:complete
MEAKENLVNLFLRKREQKEGSIRENLPKGERSERETLARKENNICFKNKIYIMRNT